MKKRIMISLFLFSITLGFSTASSGLFREFKNPVFVETGSYRGDGINQALKADYKRILSIEIDLEHFHYCKSLFKNRSNVSLYKGDSSTQLFNIIKPINQRITFWLDGHYYKNLDDIKTSMCTAFPLLLELKQIAKHPIKTHTILIDDVRCLGENKYFGITKAAVIQALKQINPDYKFTYRNGHVKNDILVAYIDK